jgi:hypothetical protein
MTGQEFRTYVGGLDKKERPIKRSEEEIVEA